MFCYNSSDNVSIESSYLQTRGAPTLVKVIDSCELCPNNACRSTYWTHRLAMHDAIWSITIQFNSINLPSIRSSKTLLMNVPWGSENVSCQYYVWEREYRTYRTELILIRKNIIDLLRGSGILGQAFTSVIIVCVV